MTVLQAVNKDFLFPKILNVSNATLLVKPVQAHFLTNVTRATPTLFC